MKGILLAKLAWLRRSPWTFILMTVMSVGFALVIGGSNVDNIKVPVYSELEEESFIVQQLKNNDSVTFEFASSSEEEVSEKVKQGYSDFGIFLYENHFEIAVGVESAIADLVRQAVNQAYAKDQQYEQMASKDSKLTKESIDEQIMDHPAFAMEISTINNDKWIYDNTLNPLFGFALFFVIYTITYSVFQMLVEKKTGIWDRMILSPLRKWEMYIANFVYSFAVGYIQIVMVFLIFRYLFDVQFHGHFKLAMLVIIPYVLAIVSLSIFLTGLVKSVQHYNAMVPIVALSMAMLGGAFWPLEIVESKIILLISNVIPIKYGLELLNGVTTYQMPISDLLTPIAILLLMSVLFTGLGIHLIERRYLT